MGSTSKYAHFLDPAILYKYHITICHVNRVRKITRKNSVTITSLHQRLVFFEFFLAYEKYFNFATALLLLFSHFSSRVWSWAQFHGAA